MRRRLHERPIIDSQLFVPAMESPSVSRCARPRPTCLCCVWGTAMSGQVAVCDRCFSSEPMRVSRRSRRRELVAPYDWSTAHFKERTGPGSYSGHTFCLCGSCTEELTALNDAHDLSLLAWVQPAPDVFTDALAEWCAHSPRGERV